MVLAGDEATGELDALVPRIPLRFAPDRLTASSPAREAMSSVSQRRNVSTRRANSSGIRSIAMCCWPSMTVTRASGRAAATVS